MIRFSIYSKITTHREFMVIVFFFSFFGTSVTTHFSCLELRPCLVAKKHVKHGDPASIQSTSAKQSVRCSSTYHFSLGLGCFVFFFFFLLFPLLLLLLLILLLIIRILLKLSQLEKKQKTRDVLFDL